MRHLHLFFTLLVVAFVTLLSPSARAAVDGFLQIPEAPGESKDAKHAGWIDVATYDEHVAGSARTFAFTMLVNKASPKLLQATTTGQTYKTALLELRKAGQQQQIFFTVRFEGVRVASVTTAFSQDVPLVRVVFTCDKATWTYWTLRQDGTLDAQFQWTSDFRGPAPLKLEDVPRVR